MATSINVYSSFYSRNDIIKHTAITGGKTLLIDALRELFRGDSIYTYRSDEYGFPLVPDFTGLPNEEGGTGLDDMGNVIDPTQLATKIYIGSSFYQDAKFYPVITVRQTGGKDHPISFNQNAILIQYRKEFVRDGYGNQTEIRTPTHFVFGDAWDQSFEVKIVAESLGDRDQIADIVMLGLKHLKRDELTKAGLFIKDLSMSGEQEEESPKHVNKTLFTYTITLNTYSEWERAIPVRNIIERINFYFDIAVSGVLPSGADDPFDNAIPNSAALIAIIP